MMKDKISACLNSTWDSTYGGINTIKAIDKLDELFRIEKSNILTSTFKYLSSEYEEDTKKSHELLEKVLPELYSLKDMQSNNVNKKAQLEQLIKDIEEQIDNE